MSNWKAKPRMNSFLVVASVVMGWLGFSAAVLAQPLVSSADVFKSVAPSVGRLVLVDAKGGVAGTASAFVVGENGLVATNYHCLVDEEDGWAAQAARVELPGQPPHTIEGVVAFDRARDWAILKTTAAGLRPIRLGDASKIETGEPVIAVGYPVGLDARPTSGTFSGWLEGDILHDASTSSGNSGGPLLDKTGKAIGITRGELKSTTGLVTLHDLFFAVDIKHIQSALLQRTVTLTRLPLPTPSKPKAASAKGEVAAGARAGKHHGGPGKTIALGVLGGGALAAGGYVLIDKGLQSLELGGQIAQFSGTLQACSYQVHQFQLKETMDVTAWVESTSPGAGTVSGYGFLGTCSGQATFTKTSGSGPSACGYESRLTQLGGCTSLMGGYTLLFLNNLPPGTHTVAVHNFGSAPASYTVKIER